MRRAMAAAAILLSCVITCGILSARISHDSNEFFKLTATMYESLESPEKAFSLYKGLCDKWRDKEELFILLSGRTATAPIEESLSGLGTALASDDTSDVKKELSDLSSKFTEIREHNIFKLENLI